MQRPSISAFVICYNRADTLATCLRGLSFVDELIVIDKSSTDESAAIARRFADHVLIVPWSPTVEETRSYALSLCRHEWVLFLDDDECLDPEAGAAIQAELARPRALIYEFPLRHYILGRHDERAYYWPEHHLRLFRRGAVTFSSTVHAGIVRHEHPTVRFAPGDGVCIHHFSNATVAGWIEKTNRYTGRLDRAGTMAGPEGLAAFAHARIDHWSARTGADSPSTYPAAAALLRAIYDMVDALKAWEADSADGAGLLQSAIKDLDAAYARHTPIVANR
jgi:hypothetical protein